MRMFANVSGLPLAAALIWTAATPVLAEAQSGTLLNGTNIDITYQVGIPDEQGEVAWETHTLAPCESHEWSWDQSGEPNLAMLVPRYVDQRKDEYGNVIMERRNVPMSADGGVSAFFLYGDQIWIDLTGQTQCAIP
jgi:hypothetical protein